MAFIKFDPTESDLTINFLSLGFEVGDTVQVSVSGDFDADGPNGDGDIYQNLSLVYYDGTPVYLFQNNIVVSESGQVRV